MSDHQNSNDSMSDIHSFNSQVVEQRESNLIYVPLEQATYEPVPKLQTAPNWAVSPAPPLPPPLPPTQGRDMTPPPPPPPPRPTPAPEAKGGTPPKSPVSPASFSSADDDIEMMSPMSRVDDDFDGELPFDHHLLANPRARKNNVIDSDEENDDNRNTTSGYTAKNPPQTPPKTLAITKSSLGVMKQHGSSGGLTNSSNFSNSTKSLTRAMDTIRMMAVTIPEEKHAKRVSCHPLINNVFADLGEGRGKGVVADDGDILSCALASAVGLYVLKTAQGLHFEFRVAKPIDPDDFFDEGMDDNDRPFKLVVKHMKGKKVIFEAIPSSTVAWVKAKIQDLSGMRIEEQVIYHNTRKLEDERTLESYGLSGNSILNVLWHPFNPNALKVLSRKLPGVPHVMLTCNLPGTSETRKMPVYFFGQDAPKAPQEPIPLTVESNALWEDLSFALIDRTTRKNRK